MPGGRSIDDTQRLAPELPRKVIASTGAKVKMPAVPGLEQAHVLTGALMRQIAAGELQDDESRRLPKWQQWLVEKGMPLAQRVMSPELMRRASKLWMPLGKQVVIVGIDLAAVELAEFLAHRGRKVHLVDSGKKIIPEVGKKRRNEHMDRLDQLRITVNTAVEILRIEQGAVIIGVGGTERAIRGDSIVVAGDPVADTALAQQLTAAGMAVRSIGDSTGPGLNVKATRTAAEAIAAL